MVLNVNAIEIRDLTKSFRGMHAVDHLSMTVPVGAIYGFIGENGSGKSTTEKLICGHLVPNHGTIKLFGKPYTDPGVRVRVGALIENAGCFPGSSVYQNLMMQAINLNCLMREILVDITENCSATVLISSHILGELEKIATHYGIIRQGRMIQELSAKDMEGRARVFVTVKTGDLQAAKKLLRQRFGNVREENGFLRVYDVDDPEAIAGYLLENGQSIRELKKNKIGLEEYYVELMSRKEGA